jgi:acetylornithine/succinyldiaminopimelate/putrescine aminotransferase
MEANEQALRVARVHSRRNGALGLAGAMHGKSFLTAALGWDNGDGLAIPGVYRIQAGPACPEDDTLHALETALRSEDVAAVFIEPVHGTSMAWEASPAFYQSVRALTRRHGSLLVYDEVLTGFFRTGTRFRFIRHEVEPDILVFGKACGNGFPVAGLAVHEHVSLSPRMLLGSTFSNNALAATVLSATLECLERMQPERTVTHIAAVVEKNLGWAREGGDIVMRGEGALWVIQLPGAEVATAVAADLYRAGVCLGFHGRQIRLLPSLTISLTRLEEACQMIAQLLRKWS